MQPLAERLRPTSLDEYVGQAHVVGPNAILRQSIESGKLPSMLLWGPPGVGKTTLASIISHQLKRPFYTLSAVNSGVKDVREAIEKAQGQKFFSTANPILFIDEIHRFSKSQQDSLLGAVEKGIVTLIGATTENPSFEVISALLSRCQVYVLKHLEKEELKQIVKVALEKDEYLREKDIEIAEYEALLMFSGGDARKLLNVLELVTNLAKPAEKFSITNELVENAIQTNLAIYDKTGEMHYDIASAFIKSMRGSDPNAAVYWLARMIEGGEDVEFIARRMIILASEDIGLANPNALLMATTCWDACRAVGFPEARIILSQCAIYLATSPKSNSAYMAIKQAQQLVRETGTLSVPLHIRNAPTKLMKDLDYGKGYQYAHDFEKNFVPQEFLPEEIQGKRLYEPSRNASEDRLRQWLKERWKEKYGF
ncbi:MAG: replication-associated recombination protein A [Saprospiraceae bacterium]|nr:replication-associated recombination protein A [Saprospiraceae bacterium]MCF8251937.1 replication-associated recombination protein A [Saprospiraceae bacterium]MCF8281637.1 replication-associated recombination protein A [Bacteroidales bacterium]MCF8313607.1 replication-associated recombination protein A [Saprospiraceae bacterium]MCF8442321.1 replication-associated recombination protein A [Saprospiraceae bacterium]